MLKQAVSWFEWRFWFWCCWDRREDAVQGCFRCERRGHCFPGEWLCRAPNFCVRTVDRLQHVKVELLAGRDADIEAIALNGIQNALSIDLEDILRPFERRVVERAAINRAKNGRFFFG